MWEIFAVECAILGFEIRNTVHEIRNPNNNWNPESKPDSGIWEILLVKFGILGFGIWNTAQGIRNPTKD